MGRSTSSDQHWTVHVDAHGNATAAYDRVGFNLSIEAITTKQLDAKDKLLQYAEAFKKVLASLSTDPAIKLDVDSLSTSSSVAKNLIYDPKKQDYVDKGYKATYVISFESTTPDEASSIYDKLLNLEGFTVSAPVFRLKQQEALKLEALKDAWLRLKQRFQTECEVVGVNSDLYEILTWQVNYQQAERGLAQYGNKMSLMAGASPKGGGFDNDEGLIQASKALITVHMHVTYGLKESK